MNHHRTFVIGPTFRDNIRVMVGFKLPLDLFYKYRLSTCHWVLFLKSCHSGHQSGRHAKMAAVLVKMADDLRSNFAESTHRFIEGKVNFLYKLTNFVWKSFKIAIFVVFDEFQTVLNSSKIRFDLQEFVIRTSYSWTLRIFWVLLFFAVKLLPYDSHRSFISVVIDNNGTWVMRIPLRVMSAR